MTREISACMCGTDSPPSVAVAAEGRLWQATLECPDCGTVVIVVDEQPITALHRAAQQWNAIADDPCVHALMRRRCPSS